MTNPHQNSRREFLRIACLTISAIVLEACASPTKGEDPALATGKPVQATHPVIEPSPMPTATTEELKFEPIFPEMVLVEAGSFQMGSMAGHKSEQPVHEVTLTRPFYIGVYALTNKEYDQFVVDQGRGFSVDQDTDRDPFPVSGVDWQEAVKYCNWLSEKAGLTPCYSGGGKVTKCDFSADGYRLPTEAEWEYAARGGLKGQGYTYAGSDDPDEVGWYADNSGGASHPVGEKKPNELGIFDMSGNRWEWCWDWYGGEYYASSPAVNPAGPSKVPQGNFVERSRRSGSAIENADTLRTAFRSRDGISYPGGNGLRVVRTA